MSCSCSSGGEIEVMKAHMAHILVLVKKTNKKEGDSKLHSS